MIDKDATWRNHRWSLDAEYCDRSSAPILESLLEKYGICFDDTHGYKFQGKAKQYIIRWPHFGGIRWNYRIPTERPKDPFQQKL